MRKNIEFALLLASLLAVLAGCLGKASAPPASKTAGALTATLALTPDSPAPMRETELRLKIMDSNARPLETADVTMDLTMPGMAMPPNHPPVLASGDGVYVAKAIFSMAGRWRIEAKVAHAGAVDSFAFELDVK